MTAQTVVYHVEVSPRWPDEGGRTHRFTVNVNDPASAYYYGTTARQIAYTVAGDFCDSGSVTVRSDDGDRATIARR